MDQEDDDIGDGRLATTLAELMLILRVRRDEGIAALPLFERVMLLHITMFLRVWLWARTKQ